MPPYSRRESCGAAGSSCGIVGLETALGLVWTELVKPGLLTPIQAIAKLSCVPANILGLKKGTLTPGADADITVFDPAPSGK